MKFWNALTRSAAAACACVTAAAASPAQGPSDDLDATLRALIHAHALTGDPVDSFKVQVPAFNDPLVRLGKLLFFTKGLSANQDVACATCHHPFLGFGDDLPLSVGVGAADPDIVGPGRHRENRPGLFPPFGIGDPAMPRNAPTLIGLPFWDQALTWDGSVFSERGGSGTAGTNKRIVAPLDSPPVSGMVASPALSHIAPVPYERKYDRGMTLAAGFALAPATFKPAMRGGAFGAGGPAGTPAMTDLDVREAIAARIGNYGAGAGALPKNDWLPLFREAFQDDASLPETLVTANRISTAIAQFERTMTFTNTPWKAYVRGDSSAISESAKRGAILFFKPHTEGGADCSMCHAGDFFTDENFSDLAVPQVGRGKGDADAPADASDDWGRERVTGKPEDRYNFRTPSLLGVEMTGPYGHTGVFSTLKEIVKHHLNVEESLRRFDYSTLPATGGPIDVAMAKEHTNLALRKLLATRAAFDPYVVENINLSDADVDNLVNFLRTLTDPCLKDLTCLSQWIPSASDPDPDGLRLCAKDGNGHEMLPGSCPRKTPSADN